MNILIYEDDLTGHHMEYLHHYHQSAIMHPDDSYIFYVPEMFKEKKAMAEWPAADNVTFRYFTTEEQRISFAGGAAIKGWHRSRILCQKAKEVKAEMVVLTMFAEFMPFVSMLLPAKMKLRGIIYNVSLWSGSGASAKKRLLDFVRYGIAVGCRSTDRMFILNNSKACDSLRRLYHTQKFAPLPDPLPIVIKQSPRNLRQQLSLADNQTVYLHFGGLAERKGTLEILKAICLDEAGRLKDSVFIFAGKIDQDIRTRFYQLLPQAEQRARVIVYDTFCTYQHLYDLCYTADIILMPYQITNLSSGIIGYASFFDKMVVGPSDGLLGQLIRENGLGVTLPTVDAAALYEFLCVHHEAIHSRAYAETNTVDKFISAIFDNAD